MQAAIEKLNGEIANNNNPYVQVIGQYLINFVSTNPGSAVQILAEDKTILGSLDAMRIEAEKVKVDNCAVLTDNQGFAIVMEYFGIDGEGAATPATKTTEKPKAKQKPKSNKGNVVPLRGGFVQTDLFDFLEEG